MFFAKDQIIESVLIILFLIPLYLFLKAISYKLFVKLSWGEDKFYNDPELKQFMSVFVHLKLCPHPDLNIEQRIKWASHWWVYGIAAFIISTALLLLAEILLHS